MKYFYDELELDVIASVYYPREDSELIAHAIKDTEIKGCKCLDMGTGSGFLAILLAKMGNVVIGADISGDAIETAEKNIEKNTVVVRTRESDLFENVSEKFDLIVFNPPYLPCGEEDGGDNTYDGGSTGREVIERFIQNVSDHLNPNGKILLLISSLSGEADTLSEFRKHGFIAKVIKRRKVEWEELMVIEAKF